MEVDRIWDSGWKRGREVYGRWKKGREEKVKGVGGRKFVPPHPHSLSVP